MNDRANDLLRLGHGLYRPTSTVTEPTDRIAAYLDALPAGTVVGGVTAARLHGLWLPSPRPDEPLEFVLTRPDTRAQQLARCRRGQIRTRRRAVLLDEVVIIGGLPVLSAPRTWVDLCESSRLADARRHHSRARRRPRGLEAGRLRSQPGLRPPVPHRAVRPGPARPARSRLVATALAGPPRQLSGAFPR